MIQALETHYAGCRFRSRAEARTAVLLDALRVRWQYEPQGYLMDGRPYLPDFWLPDLASFLQVKGQVATNAEAALAESLCAQTGHRVLIAWGDIPDPARLDDRGVPTDRGSWMERWEPDGDNAAGWDDRHVWCYCPRCGCVGAEYEGRAERIRCLHHAWTAQTGHTCGGQPQGSKVYMGLDDLVLDAYEAARSARFEHGESGAPTRLPRQRSTRSEDPPLVPARRPRSIGELLRPTLATIRGRSGQGRQS